MSKKAMIGVLVLLFAVAYLMYGETPSEATVRISSGNKTIQLSAEIADNILEIQQGLMHRTNLCESCGMLFVFDEPNNVSFWMKNMLISLDMIFVSESGEIVKIHENVPPCEADPCPSYPSEEPVKYVLEVNAGFAEKNDVSVGDFVQI